MGGSQLQLISECQVETLVSYHASALSSNFSMSVARRKTIVQLGSLGAAQNIAQVALQQKVTLEINNFEILGS